MLDYLEVFVLSILSGQFAFLSVYAAYGRLPLKFRLPIAIGLTGLITTLFIGGIDGWKNPKDYIGTGLIAVVIVCIGSGMLSALAYLSGKRFLHNPIEDQQDVALVIADSTELRSRLSIRYLFGATTIAAILCACCRFFSFAFLSEPRLWKTLLMGVFLSTFICYMTHLCLAALLKHGRLSFHLGFLAPLIFCLLLFPFAAYYPALWLAPENNPRSLIVELPLLVSFEVGYLLMLAVMFLHARSQGFRYGKPEVTA